MTSPMWTFSTSWTGYRLVRGVGWCWIMDNVPPEISSIFAEIEKALSAKLYYLAIAVSLSVPDICACLEQVQEDAKSKMGVRESYVRWCDANLNFDNLSGIDLYYICCGVAHSGHVYKNNSIYKRVIFTIEGAPIQAPRGAVINVEAGATIGGLDADANRFGGRMLMMNAEAFCRTIVDGAKAWAVSKSSDPIVQQNLPLLIRYRPEGLPPFMVGFPIVA